jgi:hypothetical protein
MVDPAANMPKISSDTAFWLNAIEEIKKQYNSKEILIMV